MRRSALLLLMWFAFSCATAGASDIVDVRLWSTNEKTRLVIETDSRLSVASFTLQNPERVVFDISVADSDMKFFFINTIDIASAENYLKAIRAARYQPGTYRIVFEMKDATIATNQLAPIAPYRHRYIIDAVANHSPDPLLALLQQLTLNATGTVTAKTEEAPEEPFIVVLDPGHGGEDPGAVGRRDKTLEKDIVLQIAKLTQRYINEQTPMRAVLTRSNDTFIPLRRRIALAEKLKGDIFVSIHADSVLSTKARGSSVYVLSEKGADTTFARQLAKHANLSDFVAGYGESKDKEVESVLRTFGFDGNQRASQQLAQCILESMGKANRLHRKDIGRAGFLVLKSPTIPSVLVETAFISNSHEEWKLRDPAFQQKMAKHIGLGIARYYREYHIIERTDG